MIGKRLGQRWFGSSSGAGGLALSELTAIGAIDGRYGRVTKPLREIFGEYGLIKSRVKVETMWIQLLSKTEGLPEISQISNDSKKFLDDVVAGFDLKEAQRVKEIEKTTNHDVKAVEYYLKEKCALGPKDLSAVTEFIHFSCTSEDINNLSYALMLQQARSDVLLPAMDDLIDDLASKAEKYHDVAVLGRTHGQPATPSTMGKELANFAYRFSRQRRQLRECEILGKMNGAVGNYAAHQMAVPNVDWPKLTQEFIKSLGLNVSMYTTQIEPHDYIAEMSDVCSRFNNIIIDLDRDMWGYISLGYFKQKVIEGEIGSSTMPQKVNPIYFEQSEGQAGLSTQTFRHLSGKLPISRFQRDLSDSTVMRSLGVGFAHQLIAIKSTLQGLSRVDCNPDRMLQELDENWEVLAEPIQTVMRRLGKEAPYEQLKALTRGKKVTGEEMARFVSGLDIPDAEKKALLDVTPAKYTGNSAYMAANVRQFLEK